jgi:hypothetical protein
MNATPRTSCRTWIGSWSGRSRVAWIAVAAIAVVGAAGCSGEDLAERVVENRLEAESGGDVDIDLDDGNIRIESDEGTFEMNADGDGNISIEGSGAEGNISIDSEDGVTVIESDDGTATISQTGAGVPDDFPASVPLPEGFEPQFSQSMSTPEGDGWILGGEMDGSPSEIGDAYLPALESAGFEQVQRTEMPDSVIFTYDDGTYSVTGMIGDDGSGGTYLNMTVAASQG